MSVNSTLEKLRSHQSPRALPASIADPVASVQESQQSLFTLEEIVLQSERERGSLLFIGEAQWVWKAEGDYK